MKRSMFKPELSVASFTGNLIVLILLLVASACQVLEDDVAGDPGNQNGNGGGNSSTNEVDLGSRSIPSDPALFATLLHNDSAKTWSAAQFTIEGFNMFLACRLDDTITLLSDGTYEYDGGGNLCGAEDNTRFRSGTWTMNPATAVLTFDEGLDTEGSGRILTLEQGTIVMEGLYESDIFGSFAVVGRYTSN